MRVTDRLIRQNSANRRNQMKKRDNGPEDMIIEKPVSTVTSLNRRKSVFESSMADGINTGESVFDRQAIFKTR